MVAFTLVIVGGLNWGLVGLFNLDLVATLFDSLGLTQLVYILVGASALYLAFTHKSDCKTCMEVMKKK